MPAYVLIHERHGEPAKTSAVCVNKAAHSVVTLLLGTRVGPRLLSAVGANNRKRIRFR
jgi:hypothetical protein